jgi:hypothetical protein
MYHKYRKYKMNATFLSENLKGMDLFGDVGVTLK